jgi:hypothetical protein
MAKLSGVVLVTGNYLVNLSCILLTGNMWLWMNWPQSLLASSLLEEGCGLLNLIYLLVGKLSSAEAVLYVLIQRMSLLRLLDLLHWLVLVLRIHIRIYGTTLHGRLISP